jgi:ADP-ribose pyrophosphatase YjhB (NUDIX family)
MNTSQAPQEKVPYALGEIADEVQQKRGWQLEVNGHVVPQVATATLMNSEMGLELKYGRHPAGYDVWSFHEPGGGGAIAVPYAIVNGHILVGTVSQNRPAAGGVINELPRGFKEPTETHEQTMTREMSEETGLRAIMNRFVILGSGKNPNTAFFDTSGEGEGLRFYGLEVNLDELELRTEENGSTFYAFRQDLLEASQAAADGSEKILGSRFVTLSEAVQDSPDLMTSAGVGLLAAHLIGARTLGLAGVEAPSPVAKH